MTATTGVAGVLIATTEGPVAIVELAREAPEFGGGVALVHDSTTLAGISGAYDALLRAPGLGLAERLEHAAWRLELSDDIDAGRSFEAGVVLAHALEAAGRLASDGERAAQALFWVTGTVEEDGHRLGGADHVRHKIAVARDDLRRKASAGQRVVIVAPQVSADQIDETTRQSLAADGIEVATCGTLDEMFRLADVALPARPAPAAPSRWLPVRQIAAAGAAIATFAALGLVAYTALQPNGPGRGSILARDCDVCPVMVALPRPVPPAIGPSSPAPGALPRATRIAIGMTEVTIAEYQAFVAATGHPVPASCKVVRSTGDYGFDLGERTFREPGYAVTPRHPATCLSLEDATAYAAWVARTTGKPYRLPTSREWEFAARAGATTHFSFGDEDADLCRHGRFAHAGTALGRLRGVALDCGGETTHGSLPVGSLTPNAWSLYDMHGNVWEWVADCAARPGRGGPAASPSPPPLAAPSGCEYGLIRGGGFNNRPPQLRSASFDVEPRTDHGRSNVKGFRLALDLGT